MNCARARGLLSEYMDGRLDEPCAGELRAHLDECAECAKAYRELQGAVNLLKAGPALSAPSGFAAAVQQRIAQGPESMGLWERITAWLRWPTYRPAFAMAMTLLIALLIGTWMLLPSRQQRDSAPDTAYLQAMMADHGSYAAEQPLADGSSEIFQSRLESTGFE